MEVQAKTVVFPTRDPERAKALFTALLGTPPYVENPYYIGFRVGDHETALDPHGHEIGMTGSVCYFEVPDVKATVSALAEHGASIVRPVSDIGSGRLVAVVRDDDGNLIGLTESTR